MKWNYRFTHVDYLPSNVFTGVNKPFADMTPIFVWHHFLMTDWVFNSHVPWILFILDISIFCLVYLLLIIFIFLLHKKYTPALPFCFPTTYCVFLIFPLIMYLMQYTRYPSTTRGSSLAVNYRTLDVRVMSDRPSTP